MLQIELLGQFFKVDNIALAISLAGNLALWAAFKAKDKAVQSILSQQAKTDGETIRVLTASGNFMEHLATEQGKGEQRLTKLIQTEGERVRDDIDRLRESINSKSDGKREGNG